MSPADKRYLDVNRRRDKISRRYARELTEEIYKANLKYIKGADLSNLENVIYPLNYPSTDVEKLVEDLYFDAGYLFSDQFVKDFAQGKFKSDLSEGIPKVQWKTEAIGKYFRSNLNQIKTISLTSEIGAQRLLNSVVYDAIQDGKGIRAVTDALKNDKFLRSLKRTSRFQAERIARTETLSAASYGEYIGSQELFQKYGVTMGKYWIAKKDARTRNSHNEMKRSETIGAEEDFEVGGSKMQFPGDRRGGPSQVINCRCALGWRRIEEETPAPPPPQANIPTPQIPEKPTGTITPNRINSIEDAEKYFKENGVHHYSVGAKRTSVHKAIAQAHADTLGEFGVELRTVHDSKYFNDVYSKGQGVNYEGSRHKRMSGNTNAQAMGEVWREKGGVRPTGVTLKKSYIEQTPNKYQPAHLKDLKQLEENVRIYEDNISYYQEQIAKETDPKKISNLQHKASLQKIGLQKNIRIIEKLKSSPWSYGSTAETIEEAVYTTSVHEFGHILDYATKNELRRIASKRHGLNGPTRYGSSNSEELVAEIFAGYHRGDLAPEFVETYKEFERYINENIKEVRERARYF